VFKSHYQNVGSNENKNDRIYILIAVLFFVIASGVVYAFTNDSIMKSLGLLKEKVSNSGTTTSDTAAVVEEKCENNWAFYKSDVLGVKFCYPSEWGVAKTEPVEYLTKLEGAVDQFSANEHNGYSNRINITFSKSTTTSLSAFNDKYKGEYYPNGNAYDLGYTDNILAVEKSGTMCDYRVNFDWETKSSLRQIISKCEDGVAVTMVEHMQQFDKALYSYDLKGQGYKKLDNQYFNNLVLTSRFGLLGQVDYKIDSLDAFFKGLADYPAKANPGISSEQYTSRKAELVKFFSGITSYKPIVRSVESFRRVEGEDAAITSIRKFYWYIDTGDFDKAYALYADKTLALDKFKDQYKNLYSVSARDVIVKNNTYDLYLDYQLQNTKPTVYHIVVTVVNDLLTIQKSEEITTAIVKSGNFKAFGKKIGNTAYMVIQEGDTEKIIEQGEAEFNENATNISKVKIFVNPYFSKSGNYLSYEVRGYEWSNTHIYGVSTGKEILTSSGTENSAFTATESHYYACASGGMSEAVGKIYKLSDGKVVYDVFAAKANQAYANIKCEYSESNNNISITLSNDAGSGAAAVTPKTILFNLATGKVQ